MVTKGAIIRAGVLVMLAASQGTVCWGEEKILHFDRSKTPPKGKVGTYIQFMPDVNMAANFERLMAINRSNERLLERLQTHEALLVPRDTHVVVCSRYVALDMLPESTTVQGLCERRLVGSSGVVQTAAACVEAKMFGKKLVPIPGIRTVSCPLAECVKGADACQAWTLTKDQIRALLAANVKPPGSPETTAPGSTIAR